MKEKIQSTSLKVDKSMSTMVHKIYNSTTFQPLNSTFYTMISLVFYIYNDLQFLHFYKKNIGTFLHSTTFFGANSTIYIYYAPPPQEGTMTI